MHSWGGKFAQCQSHNNMYFDLSKDDKLSYNNEKLNFNNSDKKYSGISVNRDHAVLDKILTLNLSLLFGVRTDIELALFMLRGE